MQTSTEIDKLAEALAKAQKAFAPIPKDREVTVHAKTGTYKFKYATLDAILSATKPALSEHGLVLAQGITEDGNGLQTKLMHASGQWIMNITGMIVSGRRGPDGQTYPPSNQELGSAQSYARRYGISSLLCITADEDDDGNIADGNEIKTSERVPYRAPAGSAGGGGEFRPSGRRPVGKGSWLEEAENDGIVATDRAKGSLAKKPEAVTAQERAKAWVDKAIGSLKEITKEQAPDWWRSNSEAPEGSNISPIDWLRDNSDKQYERLLGEYNKAAGLA